MNMTVYAKKETQFQPVYAIFQNLEQIRDMLQGKAGYHLFEVGFQRFDNSNNYFQLISYF